MAKCSFHSDKEAVEKCTICGKEMCEDCAPKFINERVACPVCAKESCKKERKSYSWIIVLAGVGLLAGIAVIAMLIALIIRDGKDEMFKYIAAGILVIAIMALAVFTLIKSIQSLKYYNKRYKIALNYELAASTTTEVEEKKEETLATTTVKATSKKAEPKKATTTAKQGEAKATTKKPATAKKVATESAAKKTATKTADVKETTTSATKTVKTAAPKKATTTATKSEKTTTTKKASTTAKTTAKKAAEKKATTKK